MDGCKPQPAARLARRWAAIARTSSGCGANWLTCKARRWPAAPASISSENTFMAPKPGAPPHAPSADPPCTQLHEKPELALRLSGQFATCEKAGRFALEQLATQYASQAQDARTEQHDAAGLRRRPAAAVVIGVVDFFFFKQKTAY